MKNFILIIILLVAPSFAESTNFGSTANVIHIKQVERLLLEQAFEQHKQSIIEAVIKIESNFNSKAYNKTEDAAGILQIRPIMVDEINRLLGFIKYTYEDRWSAEKSIEIFTDLQQFYNPNWDLETAARKWNGGFHGMKKISTIDYFKKVEEIYHAI